MHIGLRVETTPEVAHLLFHNLGNDWVHIDCRNVRGLEVQRVQYLSSSTGTDNQHALIRQSLISNTRAKLVVARVLLKIRTNTRAKIGDAGRSCSAVIHNPPPRRSMVLWIRLAFVNIDPRKRVPCGIDGVEMNHLCCGYVDGNPLICLDRQEKAKTNAKECDLDHMLPKLASQKHRCQESQNSGHDGRAGSATELHGFCAQPAPCSCSAKIECIQ